MRRLMIVLGMVLLLLTVVGVAYADEGETEIVLPNLVRDLLIGGVAVGPIIVALVQIAKRLPFFKDGWAGYLVVLLAILALALGVAAEYYKIESEVGGLLGVAETVLFAVLYVLTMTAGSVGTYKLAKTAEVVKPIKRPK